jgi:hypothetical protein
VRISNCQPGRHSRSNLRSSRPLSPQPTGFLGTLQNYIGSVGNRTTVKPDGQLLLQLVPDAAVVALLLNPNTEAAPQPLDFEQAARRLGREFRIVNAGSDTEIDAAFAALVEQRVRALVVGSDPLLFSRRGQVIALAAFRSFHLLLSLTNLAIVLTKLISKQAPTLGREGTGLMWGTTNQALAEQPWH